MGELVTVEQAYAVIRVLAWVGPAAGLVLGAAQGALHGRALTGAGRGFALGMMGPVIWALWLLYDHLVGYDPATGRAGLHSVAVLAVNALICLVVGVALGYFYAWLFAPAHAEDNPDATANQAAEDSQ